MKKYLFLTLVLLAPIIVYADIVEIDGIYYDIIVKGDVAEVTRSPIGYNGDIVIPESITYDGKKYVVTKVGNSAFHLERGVTSVTIPNSVTTIGNSAFWNCTGLCSIIIPNSVSAIEYGAFSGCTALRSITLPNSASTLGASLFSFCTGLKSVVLPNGITAIPQDMFKGCSGIESITIPNSVTSIGYDSFSGCTGLTSITIPNNVTLIEAGAFSGCSDLTTITIGKKVNTIYQAFSYCPNLEDVYCLAEQLPYIISNAFENSYIEFSTLHVPANAINNYKEEEPWKFFKNIVSIDGETPSLPKCNVPTITYEDGTLKMTCTTEEVDYITDITNSDIRKHYDSTIQLSATYMISVYATKPGYENSDVATATLCWIDSTPKTNGVTNGVSNVQARPVLIQNNDGFITIYGVEDGTRVSAYTLNGIQESTTISRNGGAILNTSAKSGCTMIVTIGNKSVKVLLK